MAIIQKLITLVRGTATEAGQAIVDVNALKILDQEIRDADTALVNSRTDLTRLMAERKLAGDKLQAKEDKLKEYNSYIQQLIDKNNQTDALAVAAKVASLENDVASDKSTLSGMDANIAKLQGSIRQAQSTIDQLKRQVDTVKATASVQRAQEAISASTSGSNVKLHTAMDSLKRLEEKQAFKAAQIDAANQLEAQGDDAELQQRLQAAGVLPGATAANDVLARFKKADV